MPISFGDVQNSRYKVKTFQLKLNPAPLQKLEKNGLFVSVEVASASHRLPRGGPAKAGGSQRSAPTPNLLARKVYGWVISEGYEDIPACVCCSRIDFQSAHRCHALTEPEAAVGVRKWVFCFIHASFELCDYAYDVVCDRFASRRSQRGPDTCGS